MLKPHRTFFTVFTALVLIIAFCGITSAQQGNLNSLIEKKNTLNTQIKKIVDEMKNLQEAGDLDGYNTKNKEYEKVKADLQIVMKDISAINAADKRVNEVKTLFNDGQRARGLARNAEAIAAYDECITKGKALNNSSLNKTISNAYYMKGYILRRQKNYIEALSNYKLAVEVYPANGSVFNAMGQLYDAMKKPAEAEIAYNDALNSGDPRATGNAYYGLGKIYFEKKKNYTKALDYFKKAFDNASAKDRRKYLKAHYIGEALYELKRPTESIPYLEQAVTLKKDYHRSLGLLGQIHYELGKYDDADTYAEDCLKYRKRDGRALIIRGDVAKKRGKKAQATEFYNQAKRDRTWRATAEHKLELMKYEEKTGKSVN